MALKVLDGALAGEAELIARLEHPAIVPIYEAGVLPDGRPFYAMKLVTGVRLDHYLESSPPLAERLRVVRRVGEVLAFAHARGTLHRDLKPQYDARFCRRSHRRLPDAKNGGACT